MEVSNVVYILLKTKLYKVVLSIADKEISIVWAHI